MCSATIVAQAAGQGTECCGGLTGAGQLAHHGREGRREGTDVDILTGPDGAMLLVSITAIALLAGVVKGVVGFALPMILISALSSIMAPEIALAALILPTLVSNGWQALRQGGRAAWQTLRRFRLFLLVGFVVMLGSARLVVVLPQAVMLLLIGVPITLYAAMMLAGRPLRLPPDPGWRVEGVIGAVAGFLGGISGAWGPPTVAMLAALDVEKKENIRIQGVIYGMGSIALAGAHLSSGVLNGNTLPLSALLLVPVMIGMWIGLRIQDRIDHAMFRKLTLWVLLLVGLNLVRRALMGA